MNSNYQSSKYYTTATVSCICIDFLQRLSDKVLPIISERYIPTYSRFKTHKSLINWILPSIINHDAETYLQLLIGAEWKTGILNTVTAGISATTIVF